MLAEQRNFNNPFEYYSIKFIKPVQKLGYQSSRQNFTAKRFICTKLKSCFEMKKENTSIEQRKKNKKKVSCTEKHKLPTKALKVKND